MIADLAPAISDAVDPMYVVAAVRCLVTDAHAGVVVSPDGQTWPMPDLPPHAALAADSQVIRVALTHLAQQQTGSTFLCPWPRPEDPDALLRVTAFTCPHQLPSHFTALVVISEPGRLRALTRRELEVLGLLVEGWPNQQIAAALFVTERTVAAHLEHIRAKLNAPTRTLAAVESLRNGLYIPLELFEDQHRLFD
jgi:DNA-binding CsgD family transcriptional regulator